MWNAGSLPGRSASIPPWTSFAEPSADSSGSEEESNAADQVDELTSAHPSKTVTPIQSAPSSQSARAPASASQAQSTSTSFRHSQASSSASRIVTVGPRPADLGNQSYQALRTFPATQPAPEAASAERIYPSISSHSLLPKLREPIRNLSSSVSISGSVSSSQPPSRQLSTPQPRRSLSSTSSSASTSLAKSGEVGLTRREKNLPSAASARRVSAAPESIASKSSTELISISIDLTLSDDEPVLKQPMARKKVQGAKSPKHNNKPRPSGSKSTVVSAGRGTQSVHGSTSTSRASDSIRKDKRDVARKSTGSVIPQSSPLKHQVHGDREGSVDSAIDDASFPSLGMSRPSVADLAEDPIASTATAGPSASQASSLRSKEERKQALRNVSSRSRSAKSPVFSSPSQSAAAPISRNSDPRSSSTSLPAKSSSISSPRTTFFKSREDGVLEILSSDDDEVVMLTDKGDKLEARVTSKPKSPPRKLGKAIPGSSSHSSMKAAGPESKLNTLNTAPGPKDKGKGRVIEPPALTALPQMRNAEFNADLFFPSASQEDTVRDAIDFSLLNDGDSMAVDQNEFFGPIEEQNMPTSDSAPDTPTEPEATAAVNDNMANTSTSILGALTVDNSDAMSKDKVVGPVTNDSTSAKRKEDVLMDSASSDAEINALLSKDTMSSSPPGSSDPARNAEEAAISNSSLQRTLSQKLENIDLSAASPAEPRAEPAMPHTPSVTSSNKITASNSSNVTSSSAPQPSPNGNGKATSPTAERRKLQLRPPTPEETCRIQPTPGWGGFVPTTTSPIRNARFTQSTQGSPSPKKVSHDGPWVSPIRASPSRNGNGASGNIQQIISTRNGSQQVASSSSAHSSPLPRKTGSPQVLSHSSPGLTRRLSHQATVDPASTFEPQEIEKPIAEASTLPSNSTSDDVARPKADNTPSKITDTSKSPDCAIGTSPAVQTPPVSPISPGRGSEGLEKLLASLKTSPTRPTLTPLSKLKGSAYKLAAKRIIEEEQRAREAGSSRPMSASTKAAPAEVIDLDEYEYELPQPSLPAANPPEGSKRRMPSLQRIVSRGEKRPKDSDSDSESSPIKSSGGERPPVDVVPSRQQQFPVARKMGKSKRPVFVGPKTQAGPAKIKASKHEIAYEDDSAHGVARKRTRQSKMKVDKGEDTSNADDDDDDMIWGIAVPQKKEKGRRRSRASDSTDHEFDSSKPVFDHFDGEDRIQSRSPSPILDFNDEIDRLAQLSISNNGYPREKPRCFPSRKVGGKAFFTRNIDPSLMKMVHYMPEWQKRQNGGRVLRSMFEAMIIDSTADEEPQAPPIRVVNDIDDDPTPPWEFFYTNKIYHADNVPPPEYKTLRGCNCIGKCNPKSTTCACVRQQVEMIQLWDEHKVAPKNSTFAYDNNGHILYNGIPIFECNDACGCTEDCVNRVVGRGRTIDIVIKKTLKKGWGIFAVQPIEHGSYIGIYSGELILEKEAHRRGLLYDVIGQSYLFDIDSHHLKPAGQQDAPSQFTMDARHVGNFTRYMNHSCDPNCFSVSVYTNDANFQKPMLVLFASRRIRAGEELTFSYFGIDSDDDDNLENSEPEEEKTERTEKVYKRCECGSKKCKGRLFS